ncbi:hypothetical protein SNE40_014335 [Patella caerulea]|uniref:Uncharacterized protein n=1 Tax=Patella caerulea TaxID=87958 RepID=A0AAN8PIX9_PATCE
MKKSSSKEPSRSETATVMSDKTDKMSTLTELSKAANDNMATGELTQPSLKGLSPEKNSKRLSDGSKRKQTSKAGNSDLEMKNLLEQILTNQNEMNEKVQIMWNSPFVESEEGDNYACGSVGSDNEMPGENNVDEDGMEASNSKKLKLDDSQSAKFISIGKKLGMQNQEITSSAVDDELAKIVNGLFTDGLTDEFYKELVKKYNKPENCELLTNIKVNQLIWDITTPKTQNMDIKFQITQTCLAKAGVILTQLADKLNKDPNADESHIEEITSAIGLLGHGFHQLCMRRRELIKHELRSEYLHLCSPSIKYTDKLFGDDIEKKVKDIRDVNRVGSRLRNFNSNSRGRFGITPSWKSGRGRGSFGGNRTGFSFLGHGRGRQPYGDTSTYNRQKPASKMKSKRE